MANYLPSPRLIPKDYRLGIYELPDSIPTHSMPLTLLPKDWAEFSDPISIQTIGENWIEKNREVALLVPSAAVPQGLEKIVVVNPNHPDCAQLELIDSTSDLYNRRTFSGL
jgi:RES domain-containing protein